MITRCVCTRPSRLLTMLAPRLAARALDVGVLVALERAELDEELAWIGRSLHHSLRQAQCGSGSRFRIRPPRNGGRTSRDRCGAARRRQIGLNDLAAGRGHDRELRCVGYGVYGVVALPRQHFEAHTHRGCVREVQQRCGVARYLDQPMRRRGTSVVDAHHHLETVLQVGKPCDCGKLQCLMCGGERRLIERLAIRGQVHMARGINRREAGLLAFVALARIVPGTTGLVGRAEDIVRADWWWPLTGRCKQCQRQSERRPHATTASPRRPTTSA